MRCEQVNNGLTKVTVRVNRLRAFLWVAFWSRPQKRPAHFAPADVQTSADHRTRNGTLLLSVPLGVLTSTVPEVAPVGTLAVISVAEPTVNSAAVPLKITELVPVRFVPRMTIFAPAMPKVGTVSTNAGRPRDSERMLPSPLE